jgi:hypothetical protein
MIGVSRLLVVEEVHEVVAVAEVARVLEAEGVPHLLDRVERRVVIEQGVVDDPGAPPPTGSR